MNWSQLVLSIQAAGWSQPQIAAACNCAQSTISDIAAGRTKDPRFSIGKALIDLAGGADRLAEEHGIQVAQALPPTAPAGQGVAHA